MIDHTCPQSDPGPDDVTDEAQCKACHPDPAPVACGPYRTAAQVSGATPKEGA